MRQKKNKTIGYKIDPSVYTEEYFLSEEYGGAKEYKQGLKTLSAAVERIYDRIPRTKEKKKFLDAGCGKGELLYFMAKKGYDVYGVDYSNTAVKMSKKLLEKKNIKGHVYNSDVRKLPFKNNFFDVVISTDVVEHLDDSTATIDFFNEIYRVLKPGGKFYVHTAPNKIHVEYFQKYYQRYINYFAFALSNLIFHTTYKLSLDIRNEHNKLVHINEQTPRSFRKNIEYSKFKNFKVELFADPFNFNLKKLPYYIIGYLYPINKIFPFNFILANHHFFVAEK